MGLCQEGASKYSLACDTSQLLLVILVSTDTFLVARSSTCEIGMRRIPPGISAKPPTQHYVEGSLYRYKSLELKLGSESTTLTTNFTPMERCSVQFTVTG